MFKDTDSGSRALAKVLDYSEYRYFLSVIKHDKEAYRTSGHQIADHFEDILEMVDIGSGAKRQFTGIKLTINSHLIKSPRACIE